MKRKQSDLPTRIYSFGCLPPVTGADLVEEQFRLAARYYNTLIEIERRRRDKVAAMMARFGDVGPLVRRIDGVPATLTPRPVPSLTLRAKTAGAAGNAVEVTCFPGSSLEVMENVAGRAVHIVFNLGTSLRHMVDAINATSKLVTADVVPGTDARGVVLGEASKFYGLLQGGVDGVAHELEAAKNAIKAKRSGEGRKADTTTEVAAVKEIAATLKTARGELKVAKEAIKTHPEVLAGHEVIKAETKTEAKAARAKSGLRHGTYVRMEDAVHRASSSKVPPRFKRYDGTGSIGTQLLATARSGDAMGMTVPELFSERDTRLQVQPVPEDTYQRRRTQRRLASRTVVRLRVGSTEKRAPVFAEFPTILHREVPADAVIKWAYVVRHSIGPDYRWLFQLTLESGSFIPPTNRIPSSAGGGVIALNFGWRNLLNGNGEVRAIRSGYWMDHQGKHGEILVPERTRTGLDKPRDLRSIRDKMFDVIRARLIAWKELVKPVAEWFVEKTQHLVRWKSPKAMHSLLSRWENERLDRDDEPSPGDISIGFATWRDNLHWDVATTGPGMLAELRAWAAQDLHLHRWQAHQTSRRIGHRREEYRRFAAWVARNYSTVIIGKMDLTSPKLSEVPAPEDGFASDGRDQRRTKALAAPGELRSCIKAAAEKYGAKLIEQEAMDKTQRCSLCRFKPEEPWKASSTIAHTCESCGRIWDQDTNHVRNMFVEYAETTDGNWLKLDPVVEIDEPNAIAASA